MSLDGTRCIDCYDRCYLSGGQCYQVNTLCQTYDSNTGACLTCYLGYAISGTTCVVSNNPNPNPNVIPNCKRMSSSGTLCIECYPRYYLNSQSCLAVNPQCQTYDSYTGACLTCYLGYAISGTTCVI